MTGKELIRAYKNGRRDFICAVLEWIDLEGANLRGANFEGADLSDANFQNADLKGTNLERADLTGADIGWADLRKANLKGANLEGVNLYRADLTDANIDFSCWPLWCGSRDVKVDKRIFTQLIAHLCVLDIDDDECKEAQNYLSKLARQSHVWKALGRKDV